MRTYDEAFRLKCRESKLGDKNPNWKGSKVSIGGIHDYVRARFPRPEKCQCCMIGYPIDMANISQEYKRDLNDWEWLCRRCHMIKDGRMKNLRQYRPKNPVRTCRFSECSRNAVARNLCLKHYKRIWRMKFAEDVVGCQ